MSEKSEQETKEIKETTTVTTTTSSTTKSHSSHHHTHHKDKKDTVNNVVHVCIHQPLQLPVKIGKSIFSSPLSFDWQLLLCMVTVIAHLRMTTLFFFTCFREFICGNM